MLIAYACLIISYCCSASHNSNATKTLIASQYFYDRAKFADDQNILDLFRESAAKVDRKAISNADLASNMAIQFFSHPDAAEDVAMAIERFTHDGRSTVLPWSIVMPAEVKHEAHWDNVYIPWINSGASQYIHTIVKLGMVVEAMAAMLMLAVCALASARTWWRLHKGVITIEAASSLELRSMVSWLTPADVVTDISHVFLFDQMTFTTFHMIACILVHSRNVTPYNYAAADVLVPYLKKPNVFIPKDMWPVDALVARAALVASEASRITDQADQHAFIASHASLAPCAADISGMLTTDYARLVYKIYLCLLADHRSKSVDMVEVQQSTLNHYPLVLTYAVLSYNADWSLLPPLRLASALFWDIKNTGKITMRTVDAIKCSVEQSKVFEELVNTKLNLQTGILEAHDLVQTLDTWRMIQARQASLIATARDLAVPGIALFEGFMSCWQSAKRFLENRLICTDMSKNEVESASELYFQSMAAEPEKDYILLVYADKCLAWKTWKKSRANYLEEMLAYYVQLLPENSRIEWVNSMRDVIRSLPSGRQFKSNLEKFKPSIQSDWQHAHYSSPTQCPITKSPTDIEDVASCVLRQGQPSADIYAQTMDGTIKNILGLYNKQTPSSQDCSHLYVFGVASTLRASAIFALCESWQPYERIGHAFKSAVSFHSVSLDEFLNGIIWLPSTIRQMAFAVANYIYWKKANGSSSMLVSKSGQILAEPLILEAKISFAQFMYLRLAQIVWTSIHSNCDAGAIQVVRAYMPMDDELASSMTANASFISRDNLNEFAYQFAAFYLLYTQARQHDYTASRSLGWPDAHSAVLHQIGTCCTTVPLLAAAIQAVVVSHYLKDLSVGKAFERLAAIRDREKTVYEIFTDKAAHGGLLFKDGRTDPGTPQLLHRSKHARESDGDLGELFKSSADNTTLDERADREMLEQRPFLTQRKTWSSAPLVPQSRHHGGRRSCVHHTAGHAEQWQHSRLHGADHTTMLPDGSYPLPIFTTGSQSVADGDDDIDPEMLALTSGVTPNAVKKQQAA